MKITMEMVSTKVAPEEEKYYMVIRLDENNNVRYASNIQYTKHGWNTRYSQIDGQPHTDARITFEEDENTYWAKTVEVTPDEP